MIYEECTAQVTDADGIGYTILVRLSYDPADPWAVTLTAVQPGAADNPWMFARELLDTGRNQPSGLGDVRVYPLPARSTEVGVAVSSDDGTAMFGLPRRVVSRFLARAARLVPAGTERVNWDAFLRDVAGA